MFLIKRFISTTGDLLLRTKLKDSLKISMRQKDKLSVNVIKSVLADIVKEEKSGIEKKASVSQLIQKGIKRRNDSIQQFREAKREDLALHEETERKVLESFLPKQLTPEEIKLKVLQIIERVEDGGAVNLGQIMKILNEELDPSLAPRRLLSDITKQILTTKYKH
jgi:uncharacterized protein